jgi:misacylated tRNA(Ala) deacylase
VKNPAYMYDAYLKKIETKVVSVNDKFVVIEDTIFYPKGGGQPCDVGSIVFEGEVYEVLSVYKLDGIISHEVDKIGLKVGDLVTCVIDFEVRYTYMKYHTASHILSGLMHKELGLKITGNQIGLDKLRVDFDLEDMDKELMIKYVEKTNHHIKRNLDVSVYFMKRDEAMQKEGIVKLAGALPPSIDELRIVEIGDVDLQADGGTHVKNTSEIGELEFVKIENKGKNNRRLIVKLK